jgi:hypothetical protein
VKFFTNIFRIIGAILLPVLVGLYLLKESKPDFQPGELEPPAAALEVGDAHLLRDVPVRLQRADGSPASDGVLIATRPVIAYAQADADGLAILRIPADGPIAFYAYSLGMQVIHWGPDQIAPQSALRFDKLVDSRPRMDPLGGTGTITLRVHDRQSDTPIPGVSILVRRAGRPDEAPWIGFSDSDGLVYLQTLPDGELRAEIYAPAMPLAPATLLGAVDFRADGDETLPAAVEAAWLQLDGLPADALAELQRVGIEGEFPDQLVGRDGSLLLGPLPAGAYLLKIAGEERELMLVSGRPPSR